MLASVTGGTGFVGSHSVAAFAAAGHRVRVLARNTSAVNVVLRPLGAGLDAVAAFGDVTDHGSGVRNHRRGHPGAVISYPPALLGPHDPRQVDHVPRRRELLPVWPLDGLPLDGFPLDGFPLVGFPLGDVRDTAAVHTETMSDTMRRPHRAARLTRRREGSLGNAHLLGGLG